MASATPSPSGPFSTLPVTEKPITWKTGWNGKKLTSVYSGNANTHLQQSTPTVFLPHTHKGNLFPALGKKCTRIITVKVQTDLQAYCSPKYKTHTLNLSALVQLRGQQSQIIMPLHKALCKPEKPTGPSLEMWQSQQGNISNLEDYCLFATWI